MDQRAEVKEFLMSRRARISPEQAGIGHSGRMRRVDGLRREEVAGLAGVSIDYYSRLERGNLKGVSDSVLRAIGDALQLDPAEREHLSDLARAAGPSPRKASHQRSDQVPPRAQHLLNAMTEMPAIITNNRTDILAANALSRALYSPLFASAAAVPNTARFIFLDPAAWDFYPNWRHAADINVAMLRLESARAPEDEQLCRLVGELSVRSEEFRTRWAAHNVRRHFTGTKRFNHPAVGVIDLQYFRTPLDPDSGLVLAMYSSEPGSPTAEAFKLLATLAATEHRTTVQTAPSRS